MKVLVLWENPNEKDYACNLAKVLDIVGGSLAAEADVSKDGSITMSMHGRALPKLTTEVGDGSHMTVNRVGRHVEIEIREPEPEPVPGPPPITDPSVWLLQAKIREHDGAT